MWRGGGGGGAAATGVEQIWCWGKIWGGGGVHSGSQRWGLATAGTVIAICAVEICVLRWPNRDDLVEGILQIGEGRRGTFVGERSWLDVCVYSN